MASDLQDDGAVGWDGCLRPSRWLSPFHAVEGAWNAEGGPSCLHVTEAAVGMEGPVLVVSCADLPGTEDLPGAGSLPLTPCCT